MTTTGGTTGVVTPLSPLTPVANLGNQYINGMRLTWASTTSFTVSVGQCRDASGLTDILMGTSEYSYANQSNEVVTSLPVAVTVKTTVTGAGGVDVSTITASKNYYVYVCGDSRGFNPATAVISLTAPVAGVNTGGVTPTSVTLPSGPTLPSGYDCFRYIGSVSTDSGSHFRPFMQTGAQALRTIWFDPGTGPSTKGLTIPSSGTSGSATYVNLGVLTTLIPQTALEAIYDVSLTPNTAGNLVFLSAPTIDNGTTAAVGSMASLSAVVTTKAQVATVRVPVSLPNATQQSGLTIGNVVTTLYATSEASDAVVFLLNGYVDQL